MLKSESNMESRRQAQQQQLYGMLALPLLFPYSIPTPPPAMPNQIFCNAFAFAFVFSYGFGCETNIKYLFIRLLFGFLSHSLSTPLSLSSPLLLLLFLLSGWHKKSQHAESE